ncbi:MAG: biotin--[acetyl-CoA-carboxylase] ligase [Ardenticatenales bacterium]|nr:biotin--[acetyl-CoA-carboxylase] ligase [Ardenticatenales bacterium]
MSQPLPLPFDVALATRWLGQPLLFRDEVDSTNRQLRQLAEGGAAGVGAVLISDFQWGGRGRRGRGWQAPRGSALLLSALLPVPTMVPLTLLPIAVAVAVAEGVEAQGEAAIQLKWPNDLLVGGKKVGGILIESAVSSAGQALLVVGIGINVNQRPAAFDALPAATSLYAALGTEVPRGPLLAAVLAALEQRWDDLQAGWQPHAAWRRRAVALGAAITVHGAAGPTWSATLRDLHHDGRLYVEDEAGRGHLLDAQEVSVRAVTADLDRL